MVESGSHPLVFPEFKLENLFSALKICKRRRIGPCREEDNRSLFYKKDISILARSGFSYEISKKILDMPKKEFIKFCKMI